MTLTLAWWNAGLSPTKSQNRASEEELQAASLVIQQLLEDVGVDFLALGEVSEDDVNALRGLLGDHLKEFDVASTQEKAGRSHFDTSLIHRKRLSVTAGASLVRRKLNRATRVAQRFAVEDSLGGKFSLYVSHWPSRGSMGPWEPERMMLGQLLRESIDLALENAPDVPLILLGDYNDEPFDPVMDNALLSSRDKCLVTRTPHLLYNPFWRHMSCFDPADEPDRHSDRGTYFHRGGQITRWRTFDQMMFSASLLSGSSGWILDEQATRVANIPNLTALLEDRSTVFDHMPIVGRLQRIQING